MDLQFANLNENKSIFLASDFHLGAPNWQESRTRERKIVNWLSSIEKDAGAVLLVGDIFDFWFDYKHVVLGGFTRFLGKIADLSDKGISVIFFTGNHDLWMFDYFQKELGIELEKKPKSYQMWDQRVYVGHGDGLGPGDRKFKLYKRLFQNGLAQWAFRWLHPDVGVPLAKIWSDRSRLEKNAPFLGDKEWLILHSKRVESKIHHDAYVYGHRHIMGEHRLNEKAVYYNLGDWVKDFSYLEIKKDSLKLKVFEA